MKNATLYFLSLTILMACSAPSEDNQYADFNSWLGVKEDTTVSIWIRNGQIIDGTGRPRYVADILVDKDRIVFVGQVDSLKVNALKVLDTKGKIMAPGFIDPHAHGDPKRTPGFQNFLTQGVTTIVLGQDGSSPNTEDLPSWMDEVEQAKPAVNVALFVGHGTIRHLSGVGYKENPKPEEITKMSALLQDAMKAGCFGMSTGLEYTPGTYASQEELITLAKIVGERSGLIMSHIRNEDDEAIEASLQELLSQGTYCPVHVSHLKVVYGKGIDRANEILNLLHTIKAKNPFPVTADIYPYLASYTGIGIVFPEWAKPPNDYEEVLEKRREELADFLRKRIAKRNGAEATLFGTAPYAGKTLAQISEEQDKPFEEVLMEISPKGASAAYFIMDEALQSQLLTDSLVMVSSDGSLTMRHPRGYGSFSKILQEYVKEKKLLSLEEAVRKMTHYPAKTLQLAERGKVAQGFFADLVVFDLEEIMVKANFSEPHQLSEGMEYVLVNGKIAIEKSKVTENRNGRMLRKKH